MKINPIINENSVTVFPKGRPLTIRKDHINFYQLRKACKEKNWSAIESLSTVEGAAKKAVKNSKLSSNVEIRNGEILYNGSSLHSVVSQKLLSMIRDGIEDASPWVRFIEKLMQNPDRNSVDQLYNFLSHKELPITPDGDVIGYKGVRDDFWSKRGNTETRVLQGKVDAGGHIWNGIGETIEVQRNCVVNDPSVSCAEGVHIGSFDYAKSWAGFSGKLVLVSFNPADAVSVPHHGIDKLRAAKYKVLADVTNSLSDIQRSCVSADGSDNAIDVSDDGLGNAIKEVIEDYGNWEEGIDVTLLEEDGYIPFGSNVTDERIESVMRKLKTIEDTCPIKSRIVKYVESQGTTTVKKIQSALSGLVNLSSSEIASRCLDYGFSVTLDASISQSKVMSI